MRIGVLHPGAMGSVVGLAAREGGHDVAWVSAGRSDESRRRAHDAGLRAFDDLRGLTNWAEVILSVVPPHAAEATARAAIDAGFRATYVDANAIAPATSERIDTLVRAGGASYVDGSIVGGPPERRGETRLYLSGEGADRVGAIFDDTRLEAVVLTRSPYAASAFKMCYAGYTKGASAMLLAIVRLARAYGLEEELRAEWALSIPDLPDRATRTEDRAPIKAWRWAGEMEEIARAFADEGLPDGFHRAAARIYASISRNDSRK